MVICQLLRIWKLTDDILKVQMKMQTLTIHRSYDFLTPQQDRPGCSLQENVVDWQSKFLVNWSESKFMAMHDAYEFYTHMLNYEKPTWNFYEVVREGFQKLHFHINIKPENTSTFKLEYAEIVRNQLIFYIAKWFRENISEPLLIDRDIIIYSRHSKHRFCYHIVVDNFALPSSAHCMDLSYRIAANLPDEFRRHVNLSLSKPGSQILVWENCKASVEHPNYKTLNTEWVPRNGDFGDVRWNLYKDDRLG
jgi:hypothetical protein